MDPEIAPAYLRHHFEPSDRLAVVILNSRTRAATQRLASAESIAADDFQRWLRHRNAQRQEIYVSMNALRPDASGRTKADIAAVRHLYLDFDHDGDEALRRLLSRPDLPPPNCRVATSPGEWQVVWKVTGFDAAEAERLQRWLARETGADPAATDVARVLRLPGFYNHKYRAPHLVTVQTHSDRVYRPSDFPAPASDRELPAAPARSRLSGAAGTQSERDWAFAKRALASGVPANLVTRAIASFRRNDKRDSRYYAELTVRKAAEALQAQQARSTPIAEGPER